MKISPQCVLSFFNRVKSTEHSMERINIIQGKRSFLLSIFLITHKIETVSSDEESICSWCNSKCSVKRNSDQSDTEENTFGYFTSPQEESMSSEEEQSYHDEDSSDNNQINGLSDASDDDSDNDNYSICPHCNERHA